MFQLGTDIMVLCKSLKCLVMLTVGLRDLNYSGVGWCRSLNTRIGGCDISSGAMKGLVLGSWHHGTQVAVLATSCLGWNSHCIVIDFAA
jgi:hypothetical protein